MEIISNGPPHKLLIIGANGGIGRQCVEIALANGHQVTALLRTPSKLDLKHTNLEIIQGDIMHPETYEAHLANVDAVISAIGVNGGLGSDKPTILYSQGNAMLLQAMKKTGIKRAFFISASAIELSPVLPFYVRLIEKYVIQKLLSNMYEDLRRMEAIIKESQSDWTIIRPPQLSNKTVTGKYRVAINVFLKDCLKISRADVAHYILHNLTNPLTHKGVIEIGY